MQPPLWFWRGLKEALASGGIVLGLYGGCAHPLIDAYSLCEILVLGIWFNNRAVVRGNLAFASTLFLRT
jgi:hydrogenase/urease accessory protein HupE